MKAIAVAVASFVFAVLASAQSPQTPPYSTAAAPGCGTGDVKFSVNTERSRHPFVKPDPGETIVYFLQDDSNFRSTPRPTTRFGLDGTWVGATHANSYFYVSVKPGEHHLCAGWQSFVLPYGKSAAALHFSAESGETYFFVVQNHAGQHQQIPAGMDFSPLESDEAQLLMSKLGYSTSRPKK
jgi:hypothetical protein